MAKSLTRMDPEKIERIAEILKTISHPVRLSVMEVLESKEKLSVSQLMKELDIEQSLLSHHLTKMKDRGILVGKREGKNIFYSLADTTILQIFDCMGRCGLVD